MQTSTSIDLGGRPIGRWRAGWLLFKETWRFMLLDKELLLVPVVSLFLNLLFFGLLIAGSFALTFGGTREIPEDSPVWLALGFAAYVVFAFIYAFSQAVIAHIVYVRAHGGNATLGQGMVRALSHAPSLLIWSIITSTVGMILQNIAERSRTLGRIVTLVLGATWKVMTYFVVPAMIVDNTSAFRAIPKSAAVFKATFGEAAVSNISFGFIAVLTILLTIASGVGLVIVAFSYELITIALFLGFFFLGLVILECLVVAVLRGILKTLLYMYAAEGKAPQNFNPELIAKIMSRQASTAGLATTVPPTSTLV